MSDADNIKCPYCERTFTVKKNLYRHIRKFHDGHEIEQNSCNKICPLCKEKFHTIHNVQSHIKSNHPDINLIYHTETFYCMDDFYEWKMKIEKESKSSFVKHRGNELLCDGRMRINYFCNRSGSYEIKAERNRRVKRNGIIKTGVTCPAHILVFIDSMDGLVEIKITYQSVHVGHKQEIGLMPLTKDERELLAGQMSLGIPTSKILAAIDPSLLDISSDNLFIDIDEVPELMHEEHAAVTKEIKKNLCQNSDLEAKRNVVISELQSLITDCQTLQNVEKLKIVEECIRLAKAKICVHPDNTPSLPKVSNVVKGQPTN